MSKEEFKEKILNLYIELIEMHKGDKAALKEIDIAFDGVLAEKIIDQNLKEEDNAPTNTI